jgi:hypothetical protein
MKQSLFVLLLFAISQSSFSQSVGVGTTSPHSSSVLEVTSANKGLLLPRITDTSAISNPAAGLFIYNQNTNSPNFF